MKEKLTNFFADAKWMTKTILALWITFLLGLTGCVSLVYMTSVDAFGWFGGMPPLEILENPRSELASELYSADGVLIGKYFRNNRSPVEYEDISPNLFNALIATEDVRFYEHSGVDGRAMLRVVWGVITANLQGGGSTVSQQLAKNLFKMRANEDYSGPLYGTRLGRGVLIKVKEWIIATRLERSYTKEEIITMYFNTVDFGSNAYGIKVACKTFFNKAPSDINVEEAGVLVGLLKATNLFSPVFNEENSKKRRNVVMNQMRVYGYLSKEEYDSLKVLPITLDYSVEGHTKGMAPHFRNIVKSKVNRWCKANGYDLFSDGLKIYTTMDSKLQQYAENSVNKHISTLQGFFDEYWDGKNPWVDEDGREIPGFIESAIKRTPTYRSLKQQYGDKKDSIDYFLNLPRKMTIFTWQGEKDTVLSPIDSIKYYKHFLHAGFMAMDPKTGYIKAWVGGHNYKYFKFDHVIQGARQPGSTFKPFLYLAALDNGYSPCDTVKDTRYTFPLKDQAEGQKNYWSPPNFTNEYKEEFITIRHGLAQSLNSIAAFLMMKMQPQTVVDYAQRLGITTPLEAVPSLALGVSDVKLYDMVGAYNVFASKGIWTEPLFVTRIEDKNGNVIKRFTSQTREALSEETAYLMLHMLQGATDWKYKTDGTAIRLRTTEYHKFGGEKYYFEGEIAAKTGTTNNYSDGWFMGILPQLVTGVWVGADDRSVHFRRGEFGQGSRMAMPIFGHFLRQVYDDSTTHIVPGEFERPINPLPVEIDCEKFYGRKFETDSSGNVIKPQNIMIENGLSDDI